MFFLQVYVDKKHQGFHIDENQFKKERLHVLIQAYKKSIEKCWYYRKVKKILLAIILTTTYLHKCIDDIHCQTKKH